MKSFQYTAFLLSAFMVFACGESKNKDENDEATVSTNRNTEIHLSKEQFDRNNMKLGQLSEQSFPSVVVTTGMIDVPPQNRAIISSFMGGYITSTPLLIGDRIGKGQLLVTLENPEFVALQQNYLETAEQLTFLKAEYERQKTLMAEKISSQKNFLKAESEYKGTLARYKGLKKKLQMLNINIASVEAGNLTSEITLYAPIHGKVTNLYVSKGTYVSPADEIMEIINTDHIHLELSVFEKDILKIKKGQKIFFKIPEAGDISYEAEVHLVGTSIAKQNRTVKVHGHLHDDENHDFAVGMFVDAQIITNTNKALALPEEAVISMEESHFVLMQTVNGGTYVFEQKEVEIGGSFNGFVEIINVGDFKTTDTFLVQGAFNLIGNDG